MRNVNHFHVVIAVNKSYCFILTMRNVNFRESTGYGTGAGRFILTMRNVNSYFISNIKRYI